MASSPPHPYAYSLGLNIPAWVSQLAACSYFLFDMAKGVPALQTALDRSTGLARLILVACILMTIFFTLSTMVLVIFEMVKITRKRMPLALYLRYTAKKTIIYGIFLLGGLIFRKRVLLIMGGTIFITSFIQVLHGVGIGTRMRKDGIPMTKEYELILDPVNADHLEAGYHYGSGPPAYEAGVPKDNASVKP